MVSRVGHEDFSFLVRRDAPGDLQLHLIRPREGAARVPCRAELDNPVVFRVSDVDVPVTVNRHIGGAGELNGGCRTSQGIGNGLPAQSNFRIRLLVVSATKTFSAPSTAIPPMPVNCPWSQMG